MLLREHRGRGEDRNLLAFHHGFESRANRDLGLAKADVAADEPIHGAGGFHVAFRLRDRAELVGAQPAAVDADAQHEVTVVEFLVLEDGGLAAVDPRSPLRVEPVPAEPSAQVGRVDRVEAGLGVDAQDPVADVQAVVVLLVLFVLVERFAVTEGPLTLASPPLPEASVLAWSV